MTGAGLTSPLCMTLGRGTMWETPKSSSEPLLHNAFSSGKTPSPKAKLPPAYLGLPATSPLINSCTREYRDWTEERPAPEGDGRTTPEEHFVWLSKDYTPYANDPETPFVPPDFTLGLPPVQDWPHQAGEPPWILDPERHPKPVRKVPLDSTGASSMDEGKKKKKKKKKHRHSKKTGDPELKVTTQGEGADTPVWTGTGSVKDLSSSSDSLSEGNSGMGSNPSFQPRRDTNTEPRRGATPRPSPDPTREPAEDDPLSERGEGDRDQEMPDANEPQGANNPVRPAPGEIPEGAQPGDDQMEAGDGEEPQEPEEPLEPYEIVLQGF